MSQTIDLSKANFSIGDPLYRIEGDYADGEYLRYSVVTKATQILQGLTKDAIVARPTKRKRSWIFELNLLENSDHNKFLFAAMEAGVGLPVSFSDGDTKIVGTGRPEDVPDSSKNTAGTTRTWRILVVDSSTSYGASATATT